MSGPPKRMESEGEMPRLLWLSVLLPLLSACGLSREELIARDKLTCTEIGFAPDTPASQDCVLRLEAARLQGHHHHY